MKKCKCNNGMNRRKKHFQRDFEKLSIGVSFGNGEGFPLWFRGKFGTLWFFCFKIQKKIRYGGRMGWKNMENLCVQCNQLFAGDGAERECRRRRQTQRRSAVWNKSWNFSIKRVQDCNFFWFLKFSFESFTILVEREFRDIHCGFFAPYEVAVRFKKSHCPAFWFYPRMYLFPRVFFVLWRNEFAFCIFFLFLPW